MITFDKERLELEMEMYFFLLNILLQKKTQQTSHKLICCVLKTQIK
jgi:hypothetical protein